MSARKLLPVAVVAVMLALLLPAAGWAQQAAAPATPQAGAPPATSTGPRASEQFKNVQVLKEVSANELLDAMRYMSAALGTNCEFCHVITPGGPPSMDKDDKKNKQTARKMIAMTLAINKDHFNGQPSVGCATCHHGHGEPDRFPPVALGSNPPPQRPERPPAGVTAAQIVEKYVAQLGGEGALQKFETKLEKGTLTRENGQTAQFEVTRKAPDKYAFSVATPNGSMSQVFSGTEGWMAFGPNSREAEGLELDRLRRDAELLPAADIKKRYPTMQLGGIVPVGDRKAYVLNARGPNRMFERFFFDTETGLLLRRMVTHHTAVGEMLEQTDYADYKNVDGVPTPFTVTRAEVSARWTEKYDDVKYGVPADDTKFQKPVKQ